MRRLNPGKLHVTDLTGDEKKNTAVPRRYTLTHSDRTGDLFLTIGPEYDQKRISRLYTRLMRDEVLAELVKNGDQLEFRVYCHVSGGLLIGTAGWRNRIFQTELPLVLEAFRYGDRALFEADSALDQTAVIVFFRSSNRKYNRVEKWGSIADYS